MGRDDGPYGSTLLEFPEMISLRLSGLLVAFILVAGCGGQAEEDEDLVIDDTDSALSGVETSDATDGPDDDGPADDGCRDGDRDGHKNHHRHWFKLLDLLDGTKDKGITIAALPEGLPDRLIAKLHRIDKNDDGIVTKKEAKRWLRHKHRAERDEREGE
jgi:hypothetical protein